MWGQLRAVKGTHPPIPGQHQLQFPHLQNGENHSFKTAQLQGELQGQPSCLPFCFHELGRESKPAAFMHLPTTPFQSIGLLLNLAPFRGSLGPEPPLLDLREARGLVPCLSAPGLRGLLPTPTRLWDAIYAFCPLKSTWQLAPPRHRDLQLWPGGGKTRLQPSLLGKSSPHLQPQP